jgi:undecaprenyl diphosphate synthase
LPSKCQRELNEAIAATQNNSQMKLILALSYSGRWDIVQATKRIASDVKVGTIQESDITEALFSKYLSTGNMPEPELMIRTSGEMRISNFLLWQLAYTEIYITETLWPDFRKQHLEEAILNYQNRERRFGKTSEQIVNI